MRWAALVLFCVLFCGMFGCASQQFVDDDAGTPPPPPVDSGPCGPGMLTKCGDTCTNLKRDPEHCNSCATKCKAGEFCVQGSCVTQCGPGTVKCNNICTATQSDPTNCGSCGTKCAAGQVCSMGKCTATCQQGLTDCNAACVDLQSDEDNCGMCGSACEAGKLCIGGKCTANCQSGWSSCPDGDGGTTCVDLQRDANNCGMCGNPCPMGFFCSPPGDGGAPTCNLQCLGGTTKCGNACKDTMIDPQNCGGCNVACAMNQICTTGHCCAKGEAYCNGACRPISQCGYVYSEAFVVNQTPSTQCTKWQQFTAGLANSYTQVKISGTNDTTGLTCTNSAVATALALALKNNTAYSASCDGHVWSNCNRYSGEVWLDPPSLCSGSNCPNPGYLLRPCIGNLNWGGVNTNTCPGPSQTMTMTFY